MKKFLNNLLIASFFFTGSCKPPDKDTDFNTTSNNTILKTHATEVVNPNTQTGENLSLVNIFLLGEDSSIMSVSNEFIAFQAQQSENLALTADPETQSDTMRSFDFTDETSIIFTQILLSTVAGNAFDENRINAEQNLNLTSLTTVRMKDSSFRAFNGVQNFFDDTIRTSWNKFKMLITGKKGKTGVQKIDYFNKAVDKKRVEINGDPPTYSEYNLINAPTSELLKTKILSTQLGGSETPGVAPYSLKGTVEKPMGQMVLGMLPEAKTLVEIRNLAKDKKFSMTSVLEDFEMNRIFHDFKKSQEAQRRETVSSFSFEYPTNKETANFTWEQFSTRDMRTIPQETLSKAIQSTAKRMENGDIIYVHCKSGKGRSATVVVGTNLELFLKDAKARRGITFSESDLKALIKEQVDNIKNDRGEIGVSTQQQNALLLYGLTRAKELNILAE